MTWYKVYIMGYLQSHSFSVDAVNIREASKKVKERLELKFYGYLIEKDSRQDYMQEGVSTDE